LHGRYGEDGCIQGLLELLNIPYTGAGVLASALAMDKVIAKQLFQNAGLPTPPWIVIQRNQVEQAKKLGFPLVVKPRSEGSSVGLAVVHSEEELEAAVCKRTQDILVEKYIPGRELSVAVLGDGAKSRCLGTVEIKPSSGLYDYQSKYEKGDTKYLVPAPLPENIVQRIEEIAVAAHSLLGCCGATRADFRWDGQDEPMLLEVNTLPGMTGSSLLPKIAARAGLSYEDLVERITCEAAVKA
ncbi:MAG: D-alanine--D-alanine ligase, partial [Pseudomonadota bacterium]